MTSSIRSDKDIEAPNNESQVKDASFSSIPLALSNLVCSTDTYEKFILPLDNPFEFSAGNNSIQCLAELSTIISAIFYRYSSQNITPITLCKVDTEQDYLKFSIEQQINSNELLSNLCQAIEATILAREDSLGDELVSISKNKKHLSDSSIVVVYQDTNSQFDYIPSENEKIVVHYAKSIDGDVLSVLYSVPTFSKNTITSFVNHLVCAAVSAFSKKLDVSVSQLKLLDLDTYKKIVDLATGPQINRNFSAPHAQIEFFAKQNSNDIAVNFLDQQLTYEELNHRANQLVSYWQHQGLQPGFKCGMLLKPDVQVPIVLLAILKFGGIYIPIDSEFPQERINLIFSDAQPDLVVCHHATSHLIHQDIVKVNLESIKKELDIANIENPGLIIDENATAYIYYTSGTTGKPKGVMGSYKNLSHYTLAAKDTYSMDKQTIMPSVAKYTFSISMFELLCPLVSGGTLMVLPREQVLDLGFMVNLLKKITMFHIGPSLLKRIVAKLKQDYSSYEAFKHIKHASTGGDLIPVELLHDLSDIFAEAEHYVIYGCSEIACMGCTFLINPCELPVKTLVGKPFSDMEVRVYDAYQNLLPPEYKGEIYFSGEGVTQGYLNNNELTEQKFIDIDGKRFYRTGDVGRLMSDGNLEVLGRQDFQIQVNGIRVELGEIDYYLRKLDDVKDAICSAQSLGDDETIRIIAYVVAEEGKALDVTKMKESLLSILPEYMLPSGFVQLDALPLNTNLKVDRKALPLANLANLMRSSHEELLPDNIEKVLSVIEQETGCKVTQSDAHLDFISFGFDSIQLVQLAKAFSAIGTVVVNFIQIAGELSNPAKVARFLINGSNIESLASCNRQESLFVAADSEGVAQWFSGRDEHCFIHAFDKKHVEYLPSHFDDKDNFIPLTSEQIEIWLACQKSSNASAAFNLSFELVFDHPVKENLLVAALTKIQQRNECLRAYIEDAVRALIICESCDLNFEKIQSQQEEDDFRYLPFSLNSAPLFRIAIDARNIGRVLICFHHIIIDGWSLDLFVKTLSESYFSLVDGNEVNAQFDSYSRIRKEEVLFEESKRLESLEYWKQVHQTPSTPLDLPSNAPRGVVRSYKASYCRYEFKEIVKANVESSAVELGVTRFGLYLSVFLILINRLSSESDITVGIPVAGQMLSGNDNVLSHNVKTLPLRRNVNRKTAVDEFVKQTFKTLKEATRHGFISFGELLPFINLDRSSDRPPLVSIIFTQDPTEAKLDFSNHSCTFRALPRQYETFDLWVNVIELDEQIYLEAQFNESLYNNEYLISWFQLFNEILIEVISCADKPVFALPTLSNNDKNKILTWNNTCHKFDAPLDLKSLFDLQVKKTPDSIAVEFDESRLTYLEFDKKSSQLAHFLLKSRCQQGDAIGVYCVRSVEMLLSIYAIIKMGGVYVPLDPDFPSDRIKYIVENSEATTVLSYGHYATEFKALETQATTINLVDSAVAIATQDDCFPDVSILPEDDAYIIYTSGSTGRPKGVVNSHGGIANRLLWKQNVFDACSADRVLFKTPFSFDVSVWEIFWPLQAGATMVIAPPDVHKDPDVLEQLIVNKRITLIHFVPSMLNAYINRPEVKPVSLRAVLCSGEALPLDLQSAFFNVFPNVQLHNLYGPTEAAVDVTHWWCDPKNHSQVVPIGKPIANTQIHIVDSKNKPLPVGVAGELLIAGVQVAKGYKNNPDMTAKSFINAKIGDDPEQKIYRTGDLARWNQKGQIEYLGRLDFQVKIRGLRIEIGEIETLLNQYRQVEQAVVVVNTNARGDQNLVAFYVNNQEINVGEFKAYLGKYLPPYMIPQIFHRLDSIPLTTSGKANRKALMEERIADTHFENRTPPTTETEIMLGTIWSRILDRDDIAREDEFFGIGGHSLLAIKFIATLKRETGIKLPYKLMSLPLCELAEAYNQNFIASRDLSKPDDRSREEADITKIDMAPEQKEIFLASSQSAEASCSYNLSSSFVIDGELNIDLLQSCLQQIVDRHQALRCYVDATSIQLSILNHFESKIRIRTLDFEIKHEVREAQILEEKETESTTPFDFSDKKPLSRYLLLQVSERRYIFMVTFHHIIADGWTRGLFIDELLKLYDASIRHKPLGLHQPVLLTDYINKRLGEQKSRSYFDSIEYWVNEFSTPLPDMILPLARDQGVTKDFRADKYEYIFDENLSSQIKEMAASCGTTLFNFMLAVYGLTLSRISQVNDLCIGVPFAGQAIEGLEVLMGQCARVLPIRIKVNEQLNFTEYLHEVAGVVARAHEHSQPTFTELFDKIKVANAKLVSNVFSMDQGEKNFNSADLTFLCEENPVKFAIFDLGLTLGIRNNQFYFEWIYNTSGYDSQSIKHWLCIYENIIRSVLLNIESPLGEIDILTTYDRNLFCSLNDTQVDISFAPACEIITDTAVSDPDVLAIACQNYAFSYRELDQKAKALALRMHDVGVAPETPVVLAVSRSSLAVLAMLAVHRSGCAYVPIDLTQPEQRLLAILHDTKARVIISDQHVPADLITDQVVINPKEFKDEPLDIASSYKYASPSADDTAYVIYTSGSTGTPKGVAVSHGNMMNLLCFMRRILDYKGNDKQLAIANFTFDPHVFEVFLPLISGASTYVASKDDILEADRLGQLIDAQGISVMQATPVTWRLLSENAWQPKSKLKATISGGEALPADARQMLLSNSEKVINAYGPTETTVLSSIEFLSAKSDPSIIGFPIDNTQCFIIDRQGRILPVGCEGELIIGGAGVSKGYLNLPDLNASRFGLTIKNLSGNYYRTGDKARILPEGKIQFRGRVDEQIKIRGLRIEPLEIEVALEKLAQIDQACVVVNQSKHPPILVAYYKSNSEINSQMLREHLIKFIPVYMLPQRFELIDEFPQTSTGKINRKKIQALPLSEDLETQVLGKPQTDTELLLVECWSEVLKLNVINRTDDFFSIGGHSLAAVKVLSQINAILGINLPINIFLQTSVLKDLAAHIDRNPINSDQRNTVVLKDGTTQPLFCLYGVLLYKDLAESLPKHQKVVGVYLNEEMELLRQENIEAFMSSFADMSVIARKYADTIKNAQSHGPYYLAGESFGGVVAFEVAQLLKREGHEVKLVALMDSWLPGKHQKLLLITRFMKHLELFANNPKPYVEAFYTRIKKWFSLSSEQAHSVGEFKKPDASIVDLRQRARDRIVKNYDPKYYSGDVVLFRASERSPFEPKDTYMGWSKFVKDINVFRIEGDHLSILTRPNVEAMARHLSAYLPNAKSNYKD